jgi:3-oxoacyl-[acyl-carrier-protein] synthase II
VTRIVITGAGAVSGYGLGVDTLWQGLRSGTSAVKHLPGALEDAWPLTIAAHVPEGLPDPPFVPSHRALHLAWLAAREALASAGNPPVEKMGLAAAIGWGDWRDQDVFTPASAADVAPRHPAANFEFLRETLGLTGPSLSCLTACAASLQSLGDAVNFIRSGRCEICLAGGGDSRLTPLGMMGYVRLGATTPRHAQEPEKASRPFDADRSGFVMGEGAGFFVVESEASAKTRGATILAEVAGVAVNCDAFRLTDPEPEGTVITACMLKCLERADMAAESLDYIGLHGTSTPANDSAEAVALRRVLRSHYGRIPAAALKSMIGHLSMASGIVELIGMLDAFRSGVIPPTLNFEHPDSALGNPGLSPRPRSAQVNTVMKNAFGFGGQNAVAVLRRA